LLQRFPDQMLGIFFLYFDSGKGIVVQPCDGVVKNF